MKICFTILLAGLASAGCPAQTGWVKNTDPNSALSQYQTFYPYIGTAFVDLDNDGWIDLYAAPKTFFRNNGDGTFQTLPPLNFNEQVAIAGASWADLDNDGDTDCVVACTPSRLFLNNGQGVFTNATAQAPGLAAYGSWAAALGDFNEDNRLDIALTHAEGFHGNSTPSPCKLYAQTGPPFAFQPVGGYPFTTELSSYTNPFWSDYDLDGDLDLFIANGPVVMPGFDPCYKNLKMETGMDTLVGMSGELFATQLQDGQCYNFIDYDNDRDLDLCLTNYFNVATRLYQNNAGVYTEVPTQFSTATTNLASCWGDYDNDGDQDVILTNDNAPCRYYRNNGNGTFSYLVSGFTTPTAVCGIANGDYDNDGDLDVFVNGVGNNGNTTSVGLYTNLSIAANRNWVNFRLKGVLSNRSAIGAIVALKAVIGGNPVWQMREVSAQNSFQSQNDLRVHFGLNNTETIDSVIVTWPSGVVQYFGGLQANTFYTLTEGEDLPSVSVADWAGPSEIRVFPNPAGGGVLQVFSNEKMQRLTLWDATGKMLFRRDFTDAQPATASNIDLAACRAAPGLLFVEVETEKGRSVQKVLRQ